MCAEPGRVLGSADCFFLRGVPFFGVFLNIMDVTLRALVTHRRDRQTNRQCDGSYFVLVTVLYQLYDVADDTQSLL